MANGDKLKTCYSQNKKIATVTKKGKIKAKKKGKVTITISLISGLDKDVRVIVK